MSRPAGCICNYNPETTDGPEEDCPWHGRWPEVAVNRPHFHEWKIVLISNVPVGAECECGEDTGFEAPPMELERGAMVKIVDPFGQPIQMVVRSVNLTRTMEGTSASIELVDPMDRMDRFWAAQNSAQKEFEWDLLDAPKSKPKQQGPIF